MSLKTNKNLFYFRKGIIFIIFLFLLSTISAQTNLKIALVKYNGGGDWYANPTSLPNLIEFCNREIDTDINSEPAVVSLNDVEIFKSPLLYLTGHGNVIFSMEEAINLRRYLEAGGFLHIDDNYGLDPFIRREMKKVFPDQEFVELPFSHPIFHQKFKFNNGLPKIHEHDNKRPQGFGLFYQGRLVCFYTYECDLGDGWEDETVHKDPFDIRLKALKMGANIVSFVFNGE